MEGMKYRWKRENLYVENKAWAIKPQLKNEKGGMLTRNILGIINNAIDGVEDELAIDQVLEESFHAGLPSTVTIIIIIFFWFFFFMGNVGLRGVAEFHSHEPHLLRDARAFTWVLLPISLPLLHHLQWSILGATQDEGLSIFPSAVHLVP